MASHRNIAVLTGDLVNSTAMGQVGIARAISVLEKASAKVEAWTGTPLHFTRHRGDGWQVVLMKPKYAFRTALLFRAALKASDPSWDCAIGIAEGVVEGHVGPNLNQETSPPFVASGRTLDGSDIFAISKRASAIAKRSRPYMNHSGKGAFEAFGVLADRICRNWTGPQAAAMQHALQPDNEPDYTEIGEKLGKSRQAVTKALASAWHDELSLALIMLEAEYP